MSDTTHLQIDSDEIVRALKLLVDKTGSGVTEIRILNAVTDLRRQPHTVSGYFDREHFEHVPAALAGIRSASGAYFTPNPVDPALLARSNNHLRNAEKGGTTSDKEIQHRFYLLVDCDPVRPSGISSSEPEHKLAEEKAYSIVAALRAAGWPDPVIADSGNGFHLIYPTTEMPTDDGGLFERVLKALDQEHSDGQVKIDTTVHNPARIWKLYGTMACKGDSTPERPHRMSRIVNVPDTFAEQLVTQEQLKALAARAPALQPQARQRPHGGTSRFDLPAWIETHDLVNRLGLSGPEPWTSQDGGRGTRRVFRTCPWNEAHTDNSAYLVQFEDGAIAAGCQHDSCAQNNWHSLRDLVEPGWQDAQGDDGRPRAADVAVQHAMESGVELFHVPGADGAAYATVRVNDHSETYLLDSKRFKRWLGRLYYMAENKGLNANAQQDAVDSLAARAVHDGPEHAVHVRVAEHNGRIYFDYGSPAWTVIEIHAGGWSEVSAPPGLKFTRPGGFQAMPPPERGGSVAEWRELLNIENDHQWALLIVSTASMFRPRRSYVLTIVNGEQGSAKTTTCRQMRMLVDPSTSLLRAEPHDVRDLAVSAANNWVLAYDNLSFIPPWLSDAFCRLATGGGFSTRQLYTDDSEFIIDVMRPVLINGIDDGLIARSDALDRSIILTLPSIPEDKRKTEEEVTAQFQRLQPRIVGALLDAVSAGMRNLPNVKLDRLPRMADFAKFGVAMEEALGLTKGAFMEAYMANREDANAIALESSVVVPVLLDLMNMEISPWIGCSTELLRMLESDVNSTEAQRRQRGWPQNPRQLMAMLKRLAPNLRASGLNVAFGSHRRNGVELTINWLDGKRPNVDKVPVPPAAVPIHGQTCSLAGSIESAHASGDSSSLLEMIRKLSPPALMATK